MWSRQGGNSRRSIVSHGVPVERGHGPRPSIGESLWIADIIVQSAVLVGLVLLMAGQWRAPPGALTLLLALDAVLVTVLNQTFQFISAAIMAGLVGDILLARLGPLDRPSVPSVRLVGVVIPTVLFAAYFAVLGFTGGIGWAVHLWGAAIVIAGVTGWLVTMVFKPPWGRPSASSPPAR